MPKRQVKKYERAAAVLVDAVFNSDKSAALKFGVSERSVRNYRKLLSEDAEFAAFFQIKKEQFDAAWVDDLPVALKKSITLIGECADSIREDQRLKKNPAVLAAVAGAMKLCAEVYMTSRVIDARIADRNRPEAELPGQVSAGAAESQYAN
jgi:hypothetical protein